jgi:hypothetical protein
MVAVGGNQYSVPDTTRRRIVEVQNHPTEVRIFEDGELIACHPVLEGKNQKRVDPSRAVQRPQINTKHRSNRRTAKQRPPHRTEYVFIKWPQDRQAVVIWCWPSSERLVHLHCDQLLPR